MRRSRMLHSEETLLGVISRSSTWPELRFLRHHSHAKFTPLGLSACIHFRLPLIWVISSSTSHMLLLRYGLFGTGIHYVAQPCHGSVFGTAYPANPTSG
ncbi:hypothetical protein L210DRAFT_708705 [Boletus edulis BED1]|uniref:Uncharacterized protein n=1 Tax=Boletus edulis BED1 TaxID=1328754 RepID=A0AAD4C4U9_BOLED|nr:hypothetical protein L210DRAFT_708705 [Boletus edulis BED1]